MAVLEFSQVKNGKEFPISIYLDANFLARWYIQNTEATNFMRFHSGKKIFTSTRAIDEFYKAIINIHMKKVHGRDWQEHYKAGFVNLKDIDTDLNKAKKWVDKLYSNGVNVLQVCHVCIGNLPTYITDLNLLPGDATHIALIKRHKIKAFATYDKDFKKIHRGGFDVYTNDKSYKFRAQTGA